jgi:hypothetical protein
LHQVKLQIDLSSQLTLRTGSMICERERSLLQELGIGVVPP